MIIQIKLGDIIVETNVMHQSTVCFAEGFVVSGMEPTFCAYVHYEDIEKEWALAGFSQNDQSRQYGKWTQLIERLAIYRKILERLPAYSMIMLHGTVVSDGRSAYLFTAPSGTGKTTRARLWIRQHPGWFFLNGDKPLLRVEKNRVVACGSPWKGKEGYGVNAEAPLKAIFLLERSDETVLTELSMAEAFSPLLQQIYVPTDSENALKAIRLLKAMDGKVRLLRFRSSPDPESVEKAWQAVHPDPDHSQPTDNA